MKTIKWIIAAVLLGTMASCSEDGLETIDEQCGCISRVITSSTYNIVDGNGGTVPYTVKNKGSWSAAPCGKPGIKAGPGSTQIETKCN